MAWLILILAVPFLGFIAFLLFGSTHVEKRRHDKQRQVNDLVRQRTAAIPTGDATSGWPAALGSAAILNRNLGTLPVVAGNTVELHPDYDGYFAAMTEAVDAAQRFVHVEFYISAWDKTTNDFFEALVRASERGVTVRLLFDHLGSRSGSGYKEMLGRLDEAGIAWRPMLPIAPLRGKVRRPDLRNHRKILVVDNTTGFMGSQNLIETTYGVAKNQKEGREYVELNVRVKGPRGPGAEPGVRDGLVQRDRRGAGRRAAAAIRIRTLTRHPHRSSARSFPVVPASPPRTTCACSPRSSTRLRTGSRSPARTSSRTSRSCTRSRQPHNEASRSSCS